MSRCKVLVVDNTPDVLNTLSGLLADAGYIVRSASSDTEALNAAIEERFDFAVIDIRLHNEDEYDETGLSLAMAIRRIDEKVRIIIITGHKIKSQQVVRAVRYYGVVDFIEKGPDVGLLIQDAIEKAGKEASLPDVLQTDSKTKLSVSLTAGQPLLLRSQGRYVRAARTWTVLRAELERYARRTELARTIPTELRFQIEEIGDRMWREIFAEHQEAATFYSEARGNSRLLLLLFETTRELLRLPLEFMRSDTPPEYVVLQHPLARFIYDAVPRTQAISPGWLAKTRKLRVLLISSDTTPSIPGVDEEVLSLADFFHEQKRVPVQLTLLSTEKASYEQVQAEIKKPGYDIIHYAGHGFFDASSPEESFICFWEGKNKRGGVRIMTAAELKMLLDQAEARLVYLSSCYSTATGKEANLLDDDFLGLADAVVQAGVPSVVGFRWPVADLCAPQLALSFYRSLLEQGSPEIALWRARREVATMNRNDPTWLSPILVHQE